MPLGKGKLTVMVLEYIQANPGDEVSPRAISKALEKSSGAIGNALERFVDKGVLVRSNDAPRRYRLDTSGPGAGSTPAVTSPTGPGEADPPAEPAKTTKTTAATPRAATRRKTPASAEQTKAPASRRAAPTRASATKTTPTAKAAPGDAMSKPTRKAAPSRRPATA